MFKVFSPRPALLALLTLSTACTVQQDSIPSLTGPSEFGISIGIAATPDSITQDGASRSSIVVTARGTKGEALPGIALRIDMAVGGVVQDFGTLSARNLVTNSDGRATATYTAPPAPPPSAGGSGNLVSIMATVVDSDFQAAAPRTVDIRLVPPGIILPPADTPTPAFTVSPTPVEAKIATRFDATSSCAGSAACTSPAGITSFQWNFGDGSTASGQQVTHAFETAGDFVVTLTVTNDRSVSASTTQTISVTTSEAPTAAFVFSPAEPGVGDEVQFNAATSSAAAGRTIVKYQWNWGDGESGTGKTQDHDYQTEGTYTVTLTVTDDVGQSDTTSEEIEVGP